MAPVIAALRRRRGPELRIASTGQHQTLLDGALDALELVPNVDLKLMRAGQPHRRLLGALPAEERPARLVVQGDTSSAWAGATAANLCGVPVAHVEADLRSGDLAAPRPQGRLAQGHQCGRRLPSRAHRGCRRGARRRGRAAGRDPRDGQQRHRFGARDDGAGRRYARIGRRGRPLRRGGIGSAHRHGHVAPSRAGAGRRGTRVRAIAARARRDDVAITLLTHPAPASRSLARESRITLLPPLDYPAMVRLLTMSHLLLTGSGAAGGGARARPAGAGAARHHRAARRRHRGLCAAGRHRPGAHRRDRDMAARPTGSARGDGACAQPLWRRLRRRPYRRGHRPAARRLSLGAPPGNAHRQPEHATIPRR